MKKLLFILALAILGSSAAYGQSKYIGMKRARAIAHKQVVGTIRSAEREKENGKMIYSFDIRTADGGTTEVNIDAITGEVIAAKVETSADEAKEKAEDKKKKKN